VHAAKHSHGSVFDVITTASLKDPAAENLLVNVCYTAHVVVYEPLNRNDWKPLMSTKPRDFVEETLNTLILLLQHALSTDMGKFHNNNPKKCLLIRCSRFSWQEGYRGHGIIGMTGNCWPNRMIESIHKCRNSTRPCHLFKLISVCLAWILKSCID
jgi:hypothetical protein